MAFLKKIITIAVVVAVLFFLLAYHYIIVDNSVKMLKKSTFTLEYTIFNTKGKEVEKILSIPQLWNDGIGELLLEEGKISEDQLELYRQKMEGEDEGA